MNPDTFLLALTLLFLALAFLVNTGTGKMLALAASIVCAILLAIAGLGAFA